MRPVQRGRSPRRADFEDYADAKPDLIDRLGSYCSYCERKINTLLAVEHIQPKGIPAYSHLEGRWDNFLLACVNCNSMKKDKDVILTDVLLPDRDNTAIAYEYMQDGKIRPSTVAINVGFETQAKAMLKLTGLDRKINLIPDGNGKYIEIDRVSQRLGTWAIAQDSKVDIDADPHNITLRKWVVKLAVERGYFSVWMTVYKTDIDMRNRLIDAFKGTRGSGCFDTLSALELTPGPNPDALADGGKI